MRLATLLAIVASIATGADKPAKFTGVVTDTMCKTNHAMMKISPDSKCVVECVRKYNSKYALNDGTNVYPLSDQSRPEQFAGKRVVVTGTLFPKTGILKVDSIEAVK
ncbi:MAG: hypothetical protein HY820_32125 [Acidobacteria bacterium]|nr:hypothetical protein [Acidobacteriota bacterium]